MKVKYRTNLCAGIISLIFGLAVLWLIPAQIGTEYSSGRGLTSRAVPGGAAMLFIVCTGLSEPDSKEGHGPGTGSGERRKGAPLHGGVRHLCNTV